MRNNEFEMSKLEEMGIRENVIAGKAMGENIDEGQYVFSIGKKDDDGRDIGDKDLEQERDPEIKQPGGLIDEGIEVEIGDIKQNDKITERQEEDIGEGMEGLPLRRKEIIDEADRYQIAGDHIEEVPIKQKKSKIKIGGVGAIISGSARSPTIYG